MPAKIEISDWDIVDALKESYTVDECAYKLDLEYTQLQNLIQRRRIPAKDLLKKMTRAKFDRETMIKTIKTQTQVYKKNRERCEKICEMLTDKLLKEASKETLIEMIDSIAGYEGTK